MTKKVIFIGAGGYAKSVLDSLDKEQYEFCGYIDHLKSIGTEHFGFPVLGNHLTDIKNLQNYYYFVAIGNNELRTKNYLLLKQQHCQVINVIDKTAIVTSTTSMGDGVFIGKMAIVNAGVTLGNNVIINTRALVEHGVTVSDHCNISTNTTLNGDVVIKEKTFVGSSSVVLGQLTIGENVMVGAGAVVINNIANNSVAVGIPAKVIKQNK